MIPGTTTAINEPCVNLTLPNGEVVKVRGTADDVSALICELLKIPGAR
jgi:hypothetical protein